MKELLFRHIIMFPLILVLTLFLFWANIHDKGFECASAPKTLLDLGLHTDITITLVVRYLYSTQATSKERLTI